jgi:hypothetical protein
MQHGASPDTPGTQQAKAVLAHHVPGHSNMAQHKDNKNIHMEEQATYRQK